MYKLLRPIGFAMLLMSLSALPLSSTYAADKPSAEREALKGKDAKEHPPTKIMDDASAPEKTGVPEGGSSSKAHPPTKTMDKAASPEKPDPGEKR